jgi:hypothetical protein
MAFGSLEGGKEFSGRPLSAGLPVIVVTEDLVRRPRVQHGKPGAVQSDLVEFVCEATPYLF